jgi:hypothetical protein
MTLLPPSLAISIATVETPKPPSEDGSTYTFTAGIALLEVEQLGLADFRFRTAVRAGAAGVRESTFADWLLDHLPADRQVIGWQLADQILPTLFEVANASPPQVALDLIDRLAAMVTLDAVDLADLHGGRASPPFAQVCAAAGIPALHMAQEDVCSAWSIGRQAELVGLLATNVIAAWRLHAKHLQPEAAEPQLFAADALRMWRIGDTGWRRWNQGEISNG